MLFKDHIRLDPAYRDALRSCGLLRVENILARVDGRIVAWSRSTDTLHVPGPPGSPGFYLKRYLYPTWRKRVRTMLRGTFFGIHRGQAEYDALQAMRALGINAVRPAACGARRTWHFVTACFLITEEVPEARNLTTFARDVLSGRQPLTRPARLEMMTALARQAAEMHAGCFSHGQLFWRNILVRHGWDGRPEFFFLDAQPLPPWRRLGPGPTWWQRELAHLTVSALRFTTRTDRLRFFLHYLGAGRLTPQAKADVRLIAAYARQWHRHERQRIKMNDLFELWNRQLERELAHGVPAEATTAPAAGAGTAR